MADSPTHRRSVFSFWRWKRRWICGVGAPLLFALYLFSAVPVTRVSYEVGALHSPLAMWALKYFYLPAFWCGKNSRIVGAVMEWEDILVQNYIQNYWFDWLQVKKHEWKTLE